MKNKWLRISFCFLICFTLIFSMCPISFAVAVSDNVYQMDCSKPTVTNNSGYVEVLYEQISTGYRFVEVVSYSFTPTLDESNEFYSTSEYINAEVTVSSTATDFIFTCNGYISGYVSLLDMSSSGGLTYRTERIDGDSFFQYTVDYGSGYKCIGYHIYGAFSNLSNFVYDGEFFVLYAEDSVINTRLNNLASILLALSEIVDENHSELVTKLESILTSISNLDSSVDSFHTDFSQKMTELFVFLEDYLDYFETLIENTDEVESYLSVMVDYLGQIQMYCEEIWYMTIYLHEELKAVNAKLQQIIDLLNAGQNQPTINTPNEGLDSAFGDVSNWFGEADNFGNQLEENKQNNQQNLAQAGNVINGFFNVIPPQIIVALAFCAIMIVVAKAIGR